MSGNSRRFLDIENSRRRNAPPLRQSLRRHPDRAGEPLRRACAGDRINKGGVFPVVSHAPYIKRLFTKNQASLHCIYKAVLYDPDMSIGLRIKTARANKRWTQKQLAERVGVTPSAVSQWERDQTIPGIDHIREIARVTNRDFNWLLGKEGLEAEVSPSAKILPKVDRAPILSRVAAGNWSETIPTEELPADTQFLEHLGGSQGQVFALEISGESMEPQFGAGDVIIVDSGIEPLPGDFVVAKLDDENETTFKKYRPRGQDEDGKPVIDLVPLNPDWPPLTISAKRPGRIVATMIEHRRYRRRR